jgi:hypothetical protein
VLVFDGDEGSGFSVEADGDVNVNGLPDLLRLMADDLAAELRAELEAKPWAGGDHG